MSKALEEGKGREKSCNYIIISNQNKKKTLKNQTKVDFVDFATVRFFHGRIPCGSWSV